MNARAALLADQLAPYMAGMKEGWQWSLSRRCSEKPEDAQQKEVSNFGNLEHLRTDTEPAEAEL